MLVGGRSVAPNTFVLGIDPERNVKFISYAVWWIRAYIQEYIRRSWSLVRFGTTRAEQRCCVGMLDEAPPSMRSVSHSRSRAARCSRST